MESNARTYIALSLLLSLLTACNGLMDLNGDGRKSRTTVKKTLNTVQFDNNIRPMDEVTLLPDYCLCLDSEAQSTGQRCQNFCAANNTSLLTLFINTELSEEVLLNPIYGEPGVVENKLLALCFTEIEDGNINPSCRALNTSGLNQVEDIGIQIYQDNSFSVELNNLNFNQEISTSLSEVTSTLQSSNNIVVERVVGYTPFPPSEALIPLSINEYQCRFIARDPNNNPFAETRTYYHYPSNSSRPLVPASSLQDFICHNQSLGVFDSPAFPGLNLITNKIRGFNPNDDDFFDANNNQILDIHEMILDKVNSPPLNFNLSQLELFVPLVWPRGPLDTTPTTQFFIANPFLRNGSSFCPNQADYYLYDQGEQTAFNAILKVLGEKALQKDFQGLFIGEAETLYFQIPTTQNFVPSPDTYDLITEDRLDTVAFVIEAGQNIKASKNDWGNRTIYYYHPLNAMDPLNQNSRRLFTVKGLPELPNLGGSSVNATSDKRIGCVLKDEI